MHYPALVIGGGITGLCAAFYLRKHLGEDGVLLIEASGSPGGYAQTIREHGFHFDAGPNGFLDREPLMLDWIADLGISGELIASNAAAARRFVLKGGRLRELVPPPAFMLSDVLSVSGRLRMLKEPFIPAKRDGEPESIHAFATRRIGQEAADTLVGPMVTGIFGGDAKKLSLKHSFPRMAAMEEEHGGLFRAMRAKARQSRIDGKKSGSPMGPGGTLTTFATGIGRLAERAVETLGSAVRCNAQVTSLCIEDAGYAVTLDSGESLTADRVVVATPIHQTAALIKPFASDAATRLENTHCCNIAVICTAYGPGAASKGADGFGFLVPRYEGLRMLGCIWTSSVFPHQAPENHLLLRTMVGGAADGNAVDLSDDELLALVAREVHPLLGIGVSPLYHRIFRHRDAIPQYGLTHGETLAAAEAIETAYRGLAFAGNGYRGVGLNDCVVSARRAVDRVL